MRSAIVGPARADLYFGSGDEAGRAAGRVRRAGRFAMLLPLELDPVAAGLGWIEYQQARAGLRKHDPKSDRDRGFVSSLGGTVKWPEPRKASVGP
jgi:hypothetical protein